MIYRILLTGFFLIAFSYCTLAQKSFYKKGNKIIYTKIKGGSDLENSKFCRITVNNETQTLLPSDISEYQLQDGRHYVSLPMANTTPEQQYFFELILDGACKLYMLNQNNQPSFFLQKGSDSLYTVWNMVILGKKSIDPTGLSAYLNNDPRVLKVINEIEYTKSSLQRLITIYNESVSNKGSSVIGTFLYGIQAGYIMSNLNKTSTVSELDRSDLDKISGSGFSVGGFCKFPISTDEWHLKGALSYHQTSYSAKKQNVLCYQSVAINNSSLAIPITISYTYNRLLKVKPYFFTGAEALIRIHNRSKVIEYKFLNDTDLETTILDKIELLSTFQPGFVMGVGSNFKLKAKHYIFFEVGITSRLNNSSVFRATDITITTGINL